MGLVGQRFYFCVFSRECFPPPLFRATALWWIHRYWTLLGQAQREQRIVGVQNMYDTYFRTVHPFPPYFDGDYWPTEVERLGLTPRMRRKPRAA